MGITTFTKKESVPITQWKTPSNLKQNTLATIEDQSNNYNDLIPQLHNLHGNKQDTNGINLATTNVFTPKDVKIISNNTIESDEAHEIMTQKP